MGCCAKAAASGQPQKRVQMLKMQLKVAFDEVDGDGGGDLDQEEFVEAFADILGNMSKTALRQMFMKIDANADGRVD
ncbi:hypothetical protein CYMTET_44538 [Cymbomonas tetramitiformis]|uniref:EF-hand domain-containing protein n=1 Tax=Cymbomonas tetramitiformis TaxID=36881 RepID=A0AAE0C194_9CHLO|nr:hypothetical protein CYMTET_44538 [Cymbomonas tetramitiformis]